MDRHKNWGKLWTNGWRAGELPFPHPSKRKKKEEKKKESKKKKKVILAVAGPMEIGTSVTQGPENQDKCDQFSLHFGKLKVYLRLAKSD